MNIAFDGKRAVSNMTGLGNYSRSLIGALAHYYPDNRYIILSPKMRHHQAIDELLQMDNVTAEPPKHTAFGHIWRSGMASVRFATVTFTSWAQMHHACPAPPARCWSCRHLATSPADSHRLVTWPCYFHSRFVCFDAMLTKSVTIHEKSTHQFAPVRSRAKGSRFKIKT